MNLSGPDDLGFEVEVNRSITLRVVAECFELVAVPAVIVPAEADGSIRCDEQGRVLVDVPAAAITAFGTLVR